MLQTDKTGLRGPLKKGILTLAGTAVLIICVSVVCAFTLVKHVTVDNGYGQTVEAVTMKNTVGELLDEQQINLNQGDVVTPSLETKLERKQSIAIQRAVAVTLQADNNQTVIYTVNQTVGELLEEAGITLGEADICNYSMEDSIEADMLVEVNRISEEPVSYTHLIHGADTGIFKGNKRASQAVLYRFQIGEYRQKSQHIIRQQPLLAGSADGTLAGHPIFGKKLEDDMGVCLSCSDVCRFAALHPCLQAARCV